MSKNQILIILVCSTLIFSLFGCIEDNTTAIIEETNKATVKYIHAEIVKGNCDVFDEVLSTDYVRHCQAMPPEFQEIHGGEKLKSFVKEFIGSISNYSDSIGPIIADSNMVAYVSTMNATQTGTMNGLPPTGKNFKIVNLVIHRFENGKIAETWVSWDNVAMLTQLGFFPPPPAEDNP